MRSRATRAASAASRGDDRAAIAERAEILRGVETERARGAEGADRLPRARREMRLAAIFDERESLAAGERREGRHIRGLAVQVHRQQRRRPARDRLLGSSRVQREPLGIDVGKHRASARHDNRDRRVRGRERRRDDLVSGADAERAKNQRERVGAVADADRVRRAGRGRELLLECLDLGPQHEPRAIDHAPDRLADGGRLLGEVKIQEGDSNAHATSTARRGRRGIRAACAR